MLIWYNIPFIALIATAFLFLGLQFLGGDNDMDHDVDLGGDFDADINLDADMDVDVDLDIDADADLDIDADGFHVLLGFLNAGRVPLSLLLMVFTFSWGALGMFYNAIFKTLWQGYPPWAFGVIFVLAAVSAGFNTRFGSKMLAGLFKESSSASRPEALIGCVGTLISGSIPREGDTGFGRARVYNEHGVLLQIACVTHEGALPPGKHNPIFVTGYDENTRRYSVLVYDSPDFHGYLNGHMDEMKRFDQRLQRSREHQLEAQKE